METLPWYQSAIVRQQIVQIVVALTALLGINLGDFKVDEVLASIFAGVAGVVAVWTLITRIFKPAPNLSATAARKEVELVENGKIPPSPTGPASERGFMTPAMVGVLACVAGIIAAVSVAGCTGTQAAYREARGDVSELAYVVTEHYASLVREAADLAQLPTTPDEAKAAMKKADAAVKPWIVGTPTAPGVRQLAKLYAEARTAENEAALQAAVNRAVIELARLIEAVKAARRS